MPLNISSVILDEVVVDPSSPAEGQAWYRSDLKEFRHYRNGSVSTWGNRKSNFTASDPLVSSDGSQGYEIGSIWFNTANKKLFFCEDPSAGAAVWSSYSNTGSATTFSDLNNTGSGDIITTAERNKLNGITAGAEVNVESDWNAVSGDAFINNKPTISGSNTGDEVQATETVVGISEIATQAEVDAGTDDSRIVTPLKLSNYSGLGGSLTSSQVTASGNTSTTSSTYVTISGMTTTPAAGDYFVSFSASGSNGTQDDGQYAIHIDGAKVADTERDIGFDGSYFGHNIRASMHTQGIITVNGSQAIKVKYLTGASTFNVYERSMILIKVG